jgi:hypothetical protein
MMRDFVKEKKLKINKQLTIQTWEKQVKFYVSVAAQTPDLIPMLLFIDVWLYRNIYRTVYSSLVYIVCSLDERKFEIWFVKVVEYFSVLHNLKILDPSNLLSSGCRGWGSFPVCKPAEMWFEFKLTSCSGTGTFWFS